MADAEPPFLHCREDGAPEGPPLVLLHTIGTEIGLWDNLVPLLDPDLRIIRLDLPGHGQSPLGPPPGRMGKLIAQVERTLDRLGIANAALLGHGLGGLVAQGLATKRLDLVRAVILSGTATKIGTRDRWTDMAARLRDPDPATVLRDLAGRWLPPKTQTEAVEALATRLARTDARALAQAAEAMAGTDFYTSTAALRLPLLGLVGALDRATPPDLMRETTDLVPGSRLTILPRAGHLAMIDTPDRYAAALTKFLKEIGHIGD